MIRVDRYSEKMKTQWDVFCSASYSGIFLFYRDYMDYHSDRFEDHSLLFWEEGTLIALLPCNEEMQYNDEEKKEERVLKSHGGLTFGGFIMGKNAHQEKMQECVAALMEYCQRVQIQKVIYKQVPVLLQERPCEQDVGAFCSAGAKLVKSIPSTVVSLQKTKMDKGAKWAISKAKRENVTVKKCESDSEWRLFYDILSEVLMRYHNVRPVHSFEELELLHKRFPNHIKLYAAFDEDTMLAGTIVYEYHSTIHTQYMASGEEGRQKCALHLCIWELMNFYQDRQWLDFGISTINGGTVIDTGLIRFKEQFGGNTLLYNTWELMMGD